MNEGKVCHGCARLNHIPQYQGRMWKCMYCGTINEDRSLDRFLQEWLKEKRHELGISQKELSERSGVSLDLIRSLECGRKDIEKMKLDTVIRLFDRGLGGQFKSFMALFADEWHKVEDRA